MKYTSIGTLVTTVVILFLTNFVFKVENKYIYININKTVKKTHQIELQNAKDRDEYFFQLMRDPKTNTIPENIRAREIKHSKTLPDRKKFLLKTAREGFDWKEIGPKDVGGRTRALAIDVTNSSRILAGGVSGGIWETTDKGASWKFLSSSSSFLSITSIAQDPRAGHTDTWYFSTGEFYGNSASIRGSSFRGNGIYKSTDNGVTWNVLPNTVSDITKFDSRYDYVSKIIVNPTTGTVFIASNGFGILKSSDGGNNFNIILGRVNDHSFSDIVVANDGTLIASISASGFSSNPPQNSPGIYVSTNDGNNWQNITPANFPDNHERTVLAIAESNTNIVYALTNTGEYNGDDEIVKVFKLDLSSGTSQDLSANLPNFSQRGSLTSQSNYDMVIAVKPDDENFVVFGTTSLFRTTDGFSTKLDDSKLDWIGGYSSEGTFHNHHPDQHIVVFDPNNPKYMWSGHDGGLSYSYDIKTTTYSKFFPWESKNHGYNVTQFYTISIPGNLGDDRVMGGTQDNGTPYFKGINTTSQDLSSGDGSFCYFGTQKAYVSSQRGRVIRLTYASNKDPYNPFNGGTGWTDVYPKNANNQLFINPFVIDPNNQNIMYYPASDTLWRNNDLSSIPNYKQGGTTIGWEALSKIDIPDGYFISTLKVSLINPEHLLYLGLSNNHGTPKIFKIENADTATDGEIDVSIPNAPSGARLQNIAINPNNGNEILVVMSNYNIIGLYHSTDGGANYTAVEGNLEGNNNNPGPSLRSAVIMPYKGETYYFVGTSTGLYSTTQLNGSNTVWVQEGADVIGNVIVQALDSRLTDHTVAVATHGRGIFIGKPNGIVGVKEEKLSNGFSLSQNYPNPFNPTTTIKYSIPADKTLHTTPQKIQIKVYDILGKEITTLVNENKLPGKYEVNFNATNLASGIYYYTLSGNNFSKTKKMMLLK